MNTWVCPKLSHDSSLITHYLRIYRRQPELGASPDAAVPAVDSERARGIERVLGDARPHGGPSDDAIDGRRRRGVPADAADAHQRIRFGDIIDEGRVAAIGIARL